MWAVTGNHSASVHAASFVEDARARTGEVDPESKPRRTLLYGPPPWMLDPEVDDGPGHALTVGQVAIDAHRTRMVSVVPDRPAPNCAALLGHELVVRVPSAVEG